jgi:predicted lipoprotein with Yx(FWY)xxD motif
MNNKCILIIVTLLVYITTFTTLAYPGCGTVKSINGKQTNIVLTPEGGAKVNTFSPSAEGESANMAECGQEEATGSDTLNKGEIM